MRLLDAWTSRLFVIEAKCQKNDIKLPVKTSIRKENVRISA